MSQSLLKNIHGPSDVKELKPEQLPQLFTQIRQFLVENVTRNGGHLASNLGVVELTVAMHRVFDSPKDHMIFDVGHQSYVHKILTGRMDRFDSLRKPGGLSGFTKRSESIHDPFGAGHSSTSLSAGLGFAIADKAKGKDNYTVVVIGDGAFTGGMIHEAMNNLEKDLHLIIILNENEMSISKNTGKFAQHLAKIRTSESYFDVKNKTKLTLKQIPGIGNSLYQGARAFKQSLKNMVYDSNYFEELGLQYLGPVDGHDYARLERVLREAKSLNQSVLVHVRTIKGHGFAPAEHNPGVFHALPPEAFYHNSALPKGDISGSGFSEFFGLTLDKLMDNDEDIVAITAAMAMGTGLTCVQHHHPNRLFDVGIAEEHALTFAAGLSAEGLKPVAAIYSSFLQRGYDSLIHDIALQNLPLTLCIDRAGLNAADGPTHHGIFDISFLSQLPNVTLFEPLSYDLFEKVLTKAVRNDRFTAIRYPKGIPSEMIRTAFYCNDNTFLPIKYTGAPNPIHLFLTYGSVAQQVLLAAQQLTEEGLSCGILLFEQLMPYEDVAAMAAEMIAPGTTHLTYVEEGLQNGGFSMILSSVFHRSYPDISRRAEQLIAITDPFRPSESDKSILALHGLDAESIAAKVRSFLNQSC